MKSTLITEGFHQFRVLFTAIQEIPGYVEYGVWRCYYLAWRNPMPWEPLVSRWPLLLTKKRKNMQGRKSPLGNINNAPPDRPHTNGPDLVTC